MTAREEVARPSAVDRFVDALLPGSGWFVALPVAACTLLALYFVCTVPLDTIGQLVFATCCIVCSLVVRRLDGRYATLVMIVLSVVATGRYMYWRLSGTLVWLHPLDAVWGALLAASEVYAAAVLILGYFQTAWPLGRKPLPLPASRAHWPSVDVFIPTYNEPLSVVKPTIYAALALDYPADKLSIHVLDDGRRPEFRAFCESVGVHWTIRDHNRHAKAGNLNEALKITNGEFVAIMCRRVRSCRSVWAGSFGIQSCPCCRRRITSFRRTRSSATSVFSDRCRTKANCFTDWCRTATISGTRRFSADRAR